MSDSRSPEIFSEVFKLLASDATEQHIAWAKRLWKLSFEYDFTACDMEIDKALIRLGLAKEGGMDDDGYPRTVYREANGRTWERFDE